MCHWTFSNIQMTLDGLMFDHVRSFPFVVTFECVMAKGSVRQHISGDVVMHIVVHGNVFEFIGCGRTKNGIVLCEFHQDWFEFVAMYKTLIPHANVIKKVLWEGIELCENFGGTRLFSRASGSF